MLLNTLRLQNYKQYGALDLEFREGLVGIIGRNGAGKSTIFEAVLYCLYGKDEINNKELIRSAFAEMKSQVLLELDFSIGDIRYRVRRELRGKKLETVTATLYKNEQQIAQGATAVNDEIVRLLKLDRDAFKRSVFSGQRELTELSDTKGEKRTKMVRKMLGLENLDDIQTEVNKDKNNLRNQIAGQEQLLLDPDARQQILDQIENQEQLLNADKLRLHAEQAQQAALEKQFQEHKIRFEAETQKLNRHNDIRRLLAQLTERSKGFSDQQLQLRNNLERQEARQVALEKEGADFVPFENNQKALRLLEDDRQKFINFEAISGKIKTLQEPIQKSREHLRNLEEQIQKLPALEQALAERRQERDRLAKEREAKVQQLQELNNAISTLEERIRDRRAKITALQTIGEDGACPTCFQPLRSAYYEVLRQLEAEVSTIQEQETAHLLQQKASVIAEGIEIKTQLDNAQEQFQHLQSEQVRLQEQQRQHKTEAGNLNQLESNLLSQETLLKKIGNFHFDQAQYDRLRAEVSATEPRYRKYLEEKNFIARELPQTRANLQKIEQGIRDTTASLQAATAELQQTGFDEPTYQQVKTVFTSFDEHLKKQNAAVQELLKATFERENLINNLREKILQHEQVQERITARQKDIELLEKLSELLKQFKTEILERVSPTISKEAGALFSRITLGKYESILVDDNFDFFIADGGVFYPLERFSGGEIDLANFCLRIAITKAIMDLGGAGQALEFLAFDEIFGSQDEERRLEMMLALNLLQEQFRQIYIISHIESQKDYFPNILEIKLEPTGSAARWLGKE